MQNRVQEGKQTNQLVSPVVAMIAVGDAAETVGKDSNYRIKMQCTSYAFSLVSSLTTQDHLTM